MPLVVYGMTLSPPVRTVLLTAKSIGLPYELKEVNLFAGEHKTPEFLKMNPLHTIPTIDDNGTILYESHAIAPYLVGKYGKDDALYPKDLLKKAIVDQRLHFDNSQLFIGLREAVMAILNGADHVPEDKKTRITETLVSLEALLGNSEWIAQTPSYTVADIALLGNLENIEAIVPCLKNHPKLAAWVERGRSKIPGFKELTTEGVAEFSKVVASKLKKA